jgi:hypothetical protein
MRRIEEERLQDGAGGGPRPGLARRREEQRGEDRREELTTHRDRLSDRGFMSELDLSVAREANVRSR